MNAWSMIADEPLAVRLHLLTVLPAFVLGTWLILASRKGSPAHRLVGVIYMVLMAVTALVSIAVRSIQPPALSVIHLFVPLTLGSIAVAIWAARTGRISLHRRAMHGLYVGGLLVAGAFTFMPGRLLHRLFFG